MKVDIDAIFLNLGAPDQAGKLPSRLTDQSDHHQFSALLFGAGKNSCFWRLNRTLMMREKAQQAINYISLAMNRVEAFTTPSYKQATIEVSLLEDMYQYVDRALHAFDYPNEALLFPYKVCHPKFFSPPLKQDLVIEFCIQDVYIACNIYALDYNFLKHGAKAGSDNQHSFVTYKDKPVMILEEVKTQTQSPTLTELKGTLKLVLEWCQTYKQMLLQIEV
ncbi:hypothetical protein MBANPS3_001654 [Mucor bainieri]